VLAVEAFMGSMLEWAQETEQRRVDARSLIRDAPLGHHRYDKATAAVMVLTGFGEPNTEPG
jgi:hypothetical protein